jgi:hypothetical protein
MTRVAFTTRTDTSHFEVALLDGRVQHLRADVAGVLARGADRHPAHDLRRVLRLLDALEELGHVKVEDLARRSACAGYGRP